MDKFGPDHFQKSLKYYNKAIKLDSTYSPSLNGRGLVFDKLKQYDSALNDFTLAMDLDPSNPVYIHNRACCLRNMGLLEKSIKDF